MVETMAQVEELIHACKTTKYASHDYETTGLRYHSPNEFPLCLGVSFQPGSAWVIPLGHPESPFKKKDKWVKVLKLFGREVLEDWEIVKIAWNLKFEGKWHMKYDIKMNGRVFDAMLGKYCLDEERPHGLKDFIDQFYPQYSGYAIPTKNLIAQPLDKVATYCGIDTDLTLRSMIYIENKLMDLGFYNLFRNLLMMGSRVLMESEYRGLKINRKYLEDLMSKYRVKIQEAETQLENTPSVRKFETKYRKKHLKQLIEKQQLEIEEIAQEGKPNAQRLINAREKKIQGYALGQFNNKERYDGFNFGSPKQLIEFLYTSKFGLGLKPIKRTEKGQPSTDEESLIALQKYDKSGFMENLMTLRGLTKINSTYIEGMHPLLDLNDRVHANFKIHGTVTGRLSCDEPNLQNIPRGTTAADIKTMFIPPAGYLLLEVDYSQAELRVVAELARDKAMIDIFQREYNIHVATACKANKALDRYDEIKKIIKIGEAIDSVELQKPENKEAFFWVKEKKKAKTINFGILYGQGPDKLAAGMGCTVPEAEAFTKQWYDAYPEVTAWIKRQKKYAHKYGYVYSIFGRKRRLYNINSDRYGLMLEAERQAVNTPIQGAASDFGLLSQIVIRDKILRGEFPRDLHQVYTVHDSIGYYIRPKHIHELVPKIIEICDNPNTKEYFGFELKHVKMKVSPEVGKDWGDLTEYHKDTDYTKWI